MGAGLAAPRRKNTPSRVARSDHLLLAFLLLRGPVGAMVGDTDAIEIAGKPGDVNKVIDAVRRGVEQG